eukprot:snap_masked-scaffold_15-processed-gene-3.5-mRNA-1 protein AED:1.00 eAED:1.00 QI:0/0/0/0/1/1/2/0/227
MEKSNYSDEWSVENMLKCQIELERHFIQKILKICEIEKFPWKVGATASLFFKRFFLLSSMGEFRPDVMLAVAIFVAAKVEEVWLNKENRGVDLKKLCTSLKLEVHQVTELEIHFLNRLSFELLVHHPRDVIDLLLLKLNHIGIKIDEIGLATKLQIFRGLVFLACENNDSPKLQELIKSEVNKDSFAKIKSLINEVAKPIDKKLSKKGLKMFSQMRKKLTVKVKSEA